VSFVGPRGRTGVIVRAWGIFYWKENMLGLWFVEFCLSGVKGRRW
jgi:hypothetical protein